MRRLSMTPRLQYGTRNLRCLARYASKPTIKMKIVRLGMEPKLDVSIFPLNSIAHACQFVHFIYFLEA